MKQFEINIDTGVQWFIWERGSKAVTAKGVPYTAAPFGVCRKDDNGLLVVFDGHIDAGIVEAVAADPLFNDVADFVIVVDEVRAGAMRGTFVRALSYLLEHKAEYGL